MGNYRLWRRRIFLFSSSSSCWMEQFNSDASLEAMYRQAPNNLKNWLWTTEGDVNSRRSTPDPHGGEWPLNFLQAVGSMLVYCCRCTNVGFVDLSTSTAPWIACKGVFLQDTPFGKLSMAAFVKASWAQSLESWLAPSRLFRWFTLQFVGRWWPRSC